MAKKNKEKKAKCELSYFLDHPQIKRSESVGNGNVPVAPSTSSGTPAPKPSIAAQINFGGKFKK